MKTKTSIYRNIFAYTLLVCVIFYGCETKNAAVQKTSTIINGRDINVYEIDSCEYIGNINGGQSDIITHKGNCKFCDERSKK
jgi:hypothetical protein